MNTSASNISRLRISQRWQWVGPMSGIAAMIALFIMGIVNNNTDLVVIATVAAAVLAGVWVAVHVALKRRIALAEDE